MDKLMADGTLIRSCPNCHEGLRIVAGQTPGISLLGRKVWANDPEVKSEYSAVEIGVPQADGDDGPSLEAGEEKGPLVRMLDHIQQAEMIAREALVSGHWGTSLYVKEGPQPGPIPDDAVPADFGVQGETTQANSGLDEKADPANETQPAFNLPAEMVVRLRIRVEVDGINV